jgi:hypothetical protein
VLFAKKRAKTLVNFNIFFWQAFLKKTRGLKEYRRKAPFLAGFF